MILIEPCPFCRSDNVILTKEPAQVPARAELGHSRLYVSCLGCGARGPWFENVDASGAIVDVISKWNERAQTKSVQ